MLVGIMPALEVPVASAGLLLWADAMQEETDGGTIAEC